MSTVTPEPDEAQHRLAVAEGLLLALGSGPRSVEAARSFLEDEDLSIDECAVQLERIVEEAKKTPLRATEGPRKGSFHGMHGRERAVRKRALLPEGSPASRAFPTDPTGTHAGPPAGTENARDDEEADTDPSLKKNSAVKGADIPVSGHDAPTPSYLFVGYPLSMAGLADDPEGRKKLREERIARVLGLAEDDQDSSGATDAAETEDEVESLPFTKPPNLRDAGDAWERCGNCIFYNKSFCNKYGYERDGEVPDNVNIGAYPVEDGDVCDSHSTLTPPDVQGTTAQRYKDRGLAEAKIRKMLGLEELWSDAAREAALAARKARVGDLAPGDHVHLPAGGVHTVIRHTDDGHTWVRHDASGERVRMSSDRVARVSAGRMSSVVESEDLSEVKSDAYPDLNRTANPDANWVSKTGGLPRYIERIAKHVHYEHGKDISRAIQIAVGVVQRWCGGGQASAHGVKAGTGGVTAATRAKACAAVAEWDAKRTAAKAGTAAKNAVKSSAKKAAKKVEEHGFWALSIAEALTLVEGADWEEARDGSSGFIPPSLAYSERIIREVEEAYSDWDEWPGGFSPEAMKAISEGELELDGATCNAYGLDASIAESIWDSARHPRDRRGEWSSVFSHMDRFKARHPRTANVLADIAKAEQKPPAPRGSREIDREIERQGQQHGAEHPSSLEDVFASLTPIGPVAVRAKRQQSSGDDDDFTVDHAIGQVVSKFPNVSDWSVDGPKEDDQGKHWMLHVKLGGGEEHHIRVGADGKVGTVEVPTQTPKPAAAPSSHKLYSLHDLESAGYQEKPYHMDDDAFFLGHDGVVYQKLESGSHLLTSKKGTPLAGVRIRSHETGTEKVAPAFAVSDYYDVYKPKGSSPSGPPAPAPSADDVFSKLLNSVKGEQPEAHGLSSFAGKHVVVTGKIEGKSRPEVEKLLSAKGAHVHSSVSNQVEYLIMGDDVGKGKVTAAKAKGVSAVHYEDVKHLIETREDRMAATRERLEEAAKRLEEATDGTEIVRARARQHVLAEQFERRWLEEKDYSHADRMRLAAEGKALANGSYPIEDEEDLHNATVLANSGHGDVAAAKALIAKRAAELGVKKAAKAAV